MSRKQGKNRKQGAIRGKGVASKKGQATWKSVLLGIVTLAVTTLVTANFTNLGNATSSLIGNLFSSTGLPIQITLVRTMPGIGDSHAFAHSFVPSDTELSQLSSLSDRIPSHEAWFTSRYGVDTDGTIAEFVVEGNRNHTVRITDIEPIVRCEAPLKGTLFYSPPAGSEPNTQLNFNLDTPGYASDKDFFGTNTVSLQQNEQYTFKILAFTNKYFCTFKLEMTVLDGKTIVTEMITNNGQPFQVSAMLNKHPITHGEFSAYQVLYIGGVMTFPSPRWIRKNPNTYNP